MATKPNLADPDFEPTDEQLIELSKRAFAHVAHERAAVLQRFQKEIAEQQANADERLERLILFWAGHGGK